MYKHARPLFSSSTLSHTTHIHNWTVVSWGHPSLFQCARDAGGNQAGLEREQGDSGEAGRERPLSHFLHTRAENAEGHCSSALCGVLCPDRERSEGSLWPGHTSGSEYTSAPTQKEDPKMHLIVTVKTRRTHLSNEPDFPWTVSMFYMWLCSIINQYSFIPRTLWSYSHIIDLRYKLSRSQAIHTSTLHYHTRACKQKGPNFSVYKTILIPLIALKLTFKHKWDYRYIKRIIKHTGLLLHSTTCMQKLDRVYDNKGLWYPTKLSS